MKTENLDKAVELASELSKTLQLLNNDASSECSAAGNLVSLLAIEEIEKVVKIKNKLKLISASLESE